MDHKIISSKKTLEISNDTPTDYESYQDKKTIITMQERGNNYISGMTKGDKVFDIVLIAIMYICLAGIYTSYTSASGNRLKKLVSTYQEEIKPQKKELKENTKKLNDLMKQYKELLNSITKNPSMVLLEEEVEEAKVLEKH